VTPDATARGTRAAIRIGLLRIDLATHAVTWQGAELEPLRPREFALLTTLAQEPGRVFTKRELEAAVLGYDGFVGSRAIDQHVVNLRAKLPDPSVVGTVRGVGYLLRAA
jgi:DNA-binding response OmpR family regulator